MGRRGMRRLFRALVIGEMCRLGFLSSFDTDRGSTRLNGVLRDEGGLLLPCIEQKVSWTGGWICYRPGVVVSVRC